MSEHGWADLRCPDCGGQLYGEVGAVSCDAGHPARLMLPKTDDVLDWCGVPAPRRAAAKGVGACVAAKGHRDEHVWWQQGKPGGRTMGLWFYGSDGRVKVHMDLRGPGALTQEDAAGLYQYLTFLAGMRAAARTHTPDEKG